MSSERKKRERELINAVLVDDLPAARSFLDIGVDVNTRDPEHDETPLMLAKSEAMVKLLLARGAQVEARDNRGQTALWFSKQTALLLAAGADPNSRDINGETPLFRAITLADFDKVDTLIAHGADVNMVNNSGETSLKTARDHGLLYLIDILIKAGATK